MKRLLFLLLTPLLTLPLWAQYNPDNPADPDVYYKLTLQAQPTSGGSVSPAQTQLAEGCVVTCRAWANDGFVFVAWMADSNVVSTERTFTFEMPANDVSLTAVFDWRPDSPDDPDARGYSHKLRLQASPTEGGWFDNDILYVVEGDTVQVRAYASSGYVFDAWLRGDTVVSSDNPLEVVMGQEDISLTARFIYKPDSPKDPYYLYTDTVTAFSSPSFRVTLDPNGGTAQYFSNYYRLGKGGSLTLHGKSNVDRIAYVKMRLQDPARCGSNLLLSSGTLDGDSIGGVDATTLTITAQGSWPQLWLTALVVAYEGSAPYGDYAIRLPQYLAHGSVTCSSDWANEGDEVWLTATPDDGYHLAHLYANQGRVTLSPTASTDQYTFTMPAEDVVVGVLFAEGAVTTGVLLNVPENSGNSSNAKPIYNLQGQRMKRPQRGINIVGGQKVVRSK